jgi:hypothetical protein
LHLEDFDASALLRSECCNHRCVLDAIETAVSAEFTALVDVCRTALSEGILFGDVEATEWTFLQFC